MGEITIQSSMATAMGARIRIVGPGRSMYMVIGNSTPPDQLVKTHGGEIAMRFNGGKMLVTLPFEGYLALKSNRSILHIGPVTVDVKRLARFSQMLARTVTTNGNSG